MPAATGGGAVAQLGERLNGIQEVGGSIPLGSTNSPGAWPWMVGPFAYRSGRRRQRADAVPRVCLRGRRECDSVAGAHS